MFRPLLSLIIGFLLFNQLNAQIDKPSLWNVHSAILDLKLKDWEEVTENDLQYFFGDFTKKGYQECLVLTNLRRKENPTDTLQGIFLYHKPKGDVYFDNEQEKVKQDKWIRHPFNVLANDIELKEVTGDATKELLLTHYQQNGNRYYQVFTIVSLVERSLQKLYQNVSWELADPSLATKGDTLAYLEKQELWTQNGQRHIKEETSIKLLETHEVDLSLLSNHTYRQYKYFTYETDTQKYVLKGQTVLLGLIDSKSISTFKDYFNDLYKCLNISSVSFGNSSPNEIAKMFDGNDKSAFQKKINLVQNRDQIDYQLEKMPDVKQEKDISFRGFYFMNGYSKSDLNWRLNGRIKTMLLKLNEEAIAFIELEDVKIGQIIDIYPFLNFDTGTLKFGDKLSFELVDFYNKNTTDVNVAITELVPFCYK